MPKLEIDEKIGKAMMVAYAKGKQELEQAPVMIERAVNLIKTQRNSEDKVATWAIVAGLAIALAEQALENPGIEVFEGDGVAPEDAPMSMAEMMQMMREVAEQSGWTKSPTKQVP